MSLLGPRFLARHIGIIHIESHELIQVEHSGQSPGLSFISPSHGDSGCSDSASVAWSLTVHRWRESQSTAWNRLSLQTSRTSPPPPPSSLGPCPSLRCHGYIACRVHDATLMPSISPDSTARSFIYSASHFLKFRVASCLCCLPASIGRSWSLTWFHHSRLSKAALIGALDVLPALHFRNTRCYEISWNVTCSEFYFCLLKDPGCEANQAAN